MRNRIPLSFLLVIGLLGSGGYALTAQAAGAVTNCSTFGSTATPGVYIPGTLGAALVGGGDITFACSGIITVVPEIRINADTHIDATGQSVILSGNNTNSVFWIFDTRLDLIDLTITGGLEGGIQNLGGTVTLTNCVVTGNTATEFGGGIRNESWTLVGTMTLINTTVSGNSASNTVTNAGGGGIFNIAKMTLINSTVSKNSVTAAPNGGASGGGIFNVTNGTLLTPGTMTLINSTVSDNTGSSSGGGIYNNAGQLTLLSSTVSGNSTTGTSASTGWGGGIGHCCGGSGSAGE